MSVQVGYADLNENPVLTVNVLARHLDANPPETTRLRHELEGKLAELANSAPFVTVARLKEAKAQAEATIARLGEQIEQAEAECGPALLADPARVTAAAKTIRKAQDQLDEANLRYRAADATLPQSEKDRAAALKEGVRQILAAMMPAWKHAIDEAENQIYQTVIAPLSEHCALDRFRQRLNRLQGARPDEIFFSCAKHPPATEPAPTG